MQEGSITRLTKQCPIRELSVTILAQDNDLNDTIAAALRHCYKESDPQHSGIDHKHRVGL